MQPSDQFERGHIIWHDGLFRGSGRPWVVLSDAHHPFHGEEYLVAGITTTDRRGNIEVSGSDWQVGGLPKTSYVSPWFLTTLKHETIDRGVGMLSSTLTAQVCTEAVAYIEG